MGNFNEKYKKETCLWGLKPSKIVRDILKYQKSGRVLDLGTGEGRNALFLAKAGFEVTGVDISQEGINKLLDLAKKFNLNVNGIVADIINFKFGGEYDIILSNSTLHFLEKPDILKIIEKMKQHTKIKGINIISAFTEENPNKKFPYLFKRNELKGIYSDWDVLEYQEYLTEIEKHGENDKPHRHANVEIIARKTPKLKN